MTSARSTHVAPLLLSVSLAFASFAVSACDDGAKEKAAAAEAAAKSAIAEADAKVEELAAATRKAKAEASKIVDEKRTSARRSLEGQANAMERRYSSLAEKAAKLQGGAKTKADKAKDTLEKARAQLGADLRDFGNLTESTFAAGSAKATASVGAFEAALDDFELAVSGKVAKRDAGR